MEHYAMRRTSLSVVSRDCPKTTTYLPLVIFEISETAVAASNAAVFPTGVVSQFLC